MAVELPNQRSDRLFLLLAGVFLTHALLGELLGGKLVAVHSDLGGLVQHRAWLMSVGVVPWPVVFVTTDLVNEYFGPKAVRRLTLLAIGLIAYAFVVVFVCINIPTAPQSPVTDEAFANVFGQSQWIIAGSLVAFAVSQLLDAGIFVTVRRITGPRLLWARAVGSTVVSQLVDTFVINGVAFALPGRLSITDTVELSATNYVYKFVIALATLPAIYLGHGLFDRYLKGHDATTSDDRAGLAQ